MKVKQKAFSKRNALEEISTAEKNYKKWPTKFLAMKGIIPDGNPYLQKESRAPKKWKLGISINYLSCCLLWVGDVLIRICKNLLKLLLTEAQMI